jgi:metal-responsive CopG/Arc/MetJ family transcriptional regulator
MKTPTRNTVTTSLPQEEFTKLNRVRERQGLSRSEAVRDAIRWYIGAIGRLPPAEEMLPDEAGAIRRGTEQIARGEYARLDHLQNELGVPTRN